MLEQVIYLVVLVVEKQRFQDLVYVLVSAVDLGLRCGKMRIYYCNFSLANFDRAADGTLIAAHTQNSSSNLSKLEIFQHFLGVSLVQDYLEESHLNVRSQLID